MGVPPPPPDSAGADGPGRGVGFRSLKRVSVSMDDTLPVDPVGAIYGRLANGLTYYVRFNPNLRMRAVLSLAVKVGSVVEEEDERGMAHIIEHLAFRATARYTNHDVVKFLESIGAKLGACQNALTTTDETIYEFSVPLDKPSLLSQAISVLAEFSTEVRMSAEDLEKERGAVLEEYRGGCNAAGLMQDSHWVQLFEGSKYADRLPIGTEKVMQNVAHETVKRFYQKWYHLSNMAIFAVGDFPDTQTVVKLIKEHFEYKAPAQLPPPIVPKFSVPSHGEPRFSCFVESKASGSVVISCKMPSGGIKTVKDYKDSLAESMFHCALNQRFFTISHTKDAPYVSCSSAIMPLICPVKAYTMTSSCHERGTVEALESMLLEVARVRLHGFSDCEISTVRALMMSEMESEYLERDQMQSISLQDELLQHFLREEAVIGTEYNAQLLKTLLAHISSVEVAKFAENFSTARSCVIKIVEPQVHASLEDLKELVLKVNTLEEEKSIPPWNEELAREGTIGQSPEPGIITDKVEHPGICSTEVIHSDDTLSCCKYTDFLDDQTDRDKVDNIKEQIFELQISLSKLIHELEELEGKLEMHSKSDILLPEISLKKQFKADGSLELDLVLAIAQCHDIFLCPYEVSHMTLRDHLSAPGAKIFRVRVVPGKKIFKDLSEDVSIRHKKYIVPQRRKSLSLEPDLRKMSPLGKFVIAGIIECIFRLHRYGLSLNGKFSLDSFHITASKKVKLDAQLKSLVCCRNPDNMKIDYASIPTVIMQILSLYGDSFPIPFDLQRLLDLLSCEDPVSNEVIIRYNVSLMDEIGKRDHFIILFDRLQQIEKEDEQKGMKNYRLKEVLKYIVAADNDDWRDKLHINSFVEMVRQRHLVDSKKIPDGAMDLLKTWRHNFTHLHEVSNEIQDKDQADILDSIEPGVINQFQQGMHSIMEIDIPHLIKTMKM